MSLAHELKEERSKHSRQEEHVRFKDTHRLKVKGKRYFMKMEMKKGEVWGKDTYTKQNRL